MSVEIQTPQSTHAQVAAKTLQESLGSMAGARRAGDEGVRWDPNEQPELANHWIETKFGVDHDVLHKVFRFFTNCQKGGRPSTPVRRGDFVKVLQNCPSLMRLFGTTQLCS